MALTSWKIFNFFDVSQIKTTGDGAKGGIFESSELSCICTGSGSLFVGTNDGHVQVFSSTFNNSRSWNAHEGSSITQMKQVEDTALLVTISEDLSNEPLLKVWALDRTDKKTGTPKCLCSLGIHNGRRQFPISAFATLDNLSQLAVGFANGAVTLIRGDLINDRGTKQRTVFESEEPITGVEFRGGANTTLYLSTTGRILTLTISGKGQGQPAKVLEDTGCGVGCMTFDESNGDIVVARDDAIQYYGIHGRGPSYAYEGPKQLVRVYKDYIAVASPPRAGTTNTKASSRHLGTNQLEDAFSTSSFALLDTDLKFIAHTELLTSQIRTVFTQWDDLFLLMVDGKLFRYHEKTMQQKLEIFFQRDLYVLAINFAQRIGVDLNTRASILRRYGDYLYKKGDYDTAMQQYLKAIDSTEPSQIIRKFLGSQRINNLIEYLEELHDHEKATVDHTTLLLNCYAKLKDTDKLEAFIKSDGHFDLDTAIAMCRQGGYFEQAVYLARKNKEVGLVVDILIEEMQAFAAALQHIRQLEATAARPVLLKYARVLLEHCPEETTSTLVDYYTGAYRPQTIQPLAAPESRTTASTNISNLASFIPLPYMQSSTPASGAKAADQPGQTAASTAVSVVDEPSYIPPSPRTAFAAFADHPYQFVVFLEACLQRARLTSDEQIALYTALFELYLEISSTKEGKDQTAWEDKAKALLEQEDTSIDASNVLLLSHLSNFKEGTTTVREQQGLRFDIFRSYTSANDTAGAIKALNKYGPLDPQLYPAALAYFTSSPKILKEAGAELEATLKKIDDDGLMAPLQVIQTLSANDVATMALLKKYLAKTIDKERKEISNNQRLVESYRQESDTKRKEMEDLNSKPAVFQSRRCATCGRSLDLPTVHFLCKHSYHQGCLNETKGQEAECPKCAPANSNIKAFRRAQEDTADRHDMFQEALNRSHDRFATISEFFGRGVMGTSTIQ